MLIDTLAYQFIENYVNRDKAFLYHDLMRRDFFEFLSLRCKRKLSGALPEADHTSVAPAYSNTKPAVRSCVLLKQ